MVNSVFLKPIFFNVDVAAHASPIGTKYILYITYDIIIIDILTSKKLDDFFNNNVCVYFFPIKIGSVKF